MMGVYKITNTITGDYYIGSSNNVERRWRRHRCQSTWNSNHKQLYVDMQKYGRDKFIMEVIEELPDADIKVLHSREQYYIEKLQPVYNMVAAYTGIDTSDRQKYKQEYRSKYANKEKQQKKQYYSQQCNYKGEALTLDALRKRFQRQGIEHPTIEAKKYLICQK